MSPPDGRGMPPINKLPDLEGKYKTINGKVGALIPATASLPHFMSGGRSACRRRECLPEQICAKYPVQHYTLRSAETEIFAEVEPDQERQ